MTTAQQEKPTPAASWDEHYGDERGEGAVRRKDA
jgi:hypothetical protein